MPLDPLAKIASAVDAIEAALVADPIETSTLRTQLRLLKLYVPQVPEADDGTVNARFPNLPALITQVESMLQDAEQADSIANGGAPLGFALVEFD